MSTVDWNELKFDKRARADPALEPFPLELLKFVGVVFYMGSGVNVSW